MTGRLRATLMPEAHAVVQQPGVDRALAGELRTAMDVDRAHLVMLAETGVVEAATARAIVGAIDELDAADLAPLRDRPAPRGWYLMYEGYLAERLDLEVAGWLPTARSRNDLSATLAQLGLRPVFARLAGGALELQAALLERAGAHLRTVMPGFTHGQPALPVTYGHWLGGVATALARDLGHLMGSLGDLDESPLGAGAMGGTSLPIDPHRTAELLGFTGPAPNSLAAVASRDTAMRLVASTTVIGTLLSRVATDLHAWTGAAPPLLVLPDSLVGLSSMMPQKRNAYLLEHVQGRAAAPLAAFTAMAAGAQKTPFTNSIAVHTEATRYVHDAVEATTEAITLLRLVVQHAEPDPAVMAERAEAGLTQATEVANRLAFSPSGPAGTGRAPGFRAAHELVGAAARTAVEEHRPLLSALPLPLPPGVRPEELDVAAVAGANRYGGGPSPETVAPVLTALGADLEQHRAALRATTARWDGTHDRIAAAVTALEES